MKRAYPLKLYCSSAALILSLVVAPSSIAAVDPKIHSICSQAVDYAGCVKAMSGAPPVGEPEQNIKQTYDSLRRLASRMRTGINKNSYSNEWGEVAFGLSETMSKQSGKKKAAMQEVYDAFNDIQVYWNCMFTVDFASSMPGLCLGRDFQYRNPYIIEILRKSYNRSYEMGSLVAVLMTKASEKLDYLGTLLTTQ